MTLYGADYYRYGSHEWDFEEDLADLVGQMEYAQDDGLLSFHGYWKMTPDGWVTADDEAAPLVEERRRAERAGYDNGQVERASKPYVLVLIGPADAESYWSWHETTTQATLASREWTDKGVATRIDRQDESGRITAHDVPQSAGRDAETP